MKKELFVHLQHLAIQSLQLRYLLKRLMPEQHLC